MITFGKGYLYHDGKVYREIQPDQSRKTPRWRLTDKTGKRHWLSLAQIQSIIAKKTKK